jgi:colanic acid/amylovoran biosynthesis glycosyltransferase
MSRLVGHAWRHRREPASRFLQATYLKSAFIGYELDILHVEFDAQAIGVADLKTFLQCKLLLSARGTFQQLSTLDSTPDALSYLFRYVDGYHFISRFLERNTRALGLPGSIPTWLIEPAIDLALFEPVKRTSVRDTLRVISVGRLSWEKGYEIALHVIAGVRARGIDVHYTIYGDGPYRDAIRYAISQLDLADRVSLAGNVDREAMPAAYASADVMLHTALAEGFCNAVIEAQAMELPCVVSDAGGLPENVEHGITGYVVPRREIDGFVDRLVDLATDPRLRSTLGAAGRHRARARFDLDRQAEAFVEMYRELAARK